jgi:NitT/TauT family transport system substrate-binding protein
MRATKLTVAGKIVIFAIILAIVGGILYFTGALDALKPGKLDVNISNGTNTVGGNTNTAGNVNTSKSSDALRISLDEWIGWKPILDANGGLETKKGSIYDKLGLKVNISIINDATQSSIALINNNLDGAGYTINRYAFLYPKFKENNVPVKMAYITNYSNGGDGIIAKSTINSIEDLVGKKIGVPRFSEAQTLVEWLLSKSSLTDDQVRNIRKNMVMFNTPDDAAKAFFGGQVDAAATWQPYLTQATTTTGAKILFSTKAATNIILDGIVFRDDYSLANNDKITKFIEGAIKAGDLYKKETAPIKDSMPLFATETNENIIAMTGDAALANYAANTELFKGVAQTLYTDMANIWKALGEKSDPGSVKDAFDITTMANMAEKFANTVPIVEKPKFTEQEREKAKQQDNKQALLTQKLSVNFDTGAATIKDNSYFNLNKFAETAKILNGVVIQIEGNTDDVGLDAANKTLSYNRAKAVATYLQFQGLDPTRFVVIGNGEEKPVANNGTAEGKAANRRTDAFFKIVK